jgi:DNA polymerase III alpha subunit (gram-positive type)
MTVRKKRIHGHDYWYEQKSIRAGQKVMTQHIKYIGKSSEVPISHRDISLGSMVEEAKYTHLRRAKKLYISGKDFIVCDVETTGFSPSRGDRLIEIAYQKYRINHDELQKTGNLCCFFVNPERSIPVKIQKLTGITNLHVRRGISQLEAKKRLNKDIKDHVVVGHNFLFDLRFLNYRNRNKISEDKIIDTIHLSRLYEEKKGLNISNSLDAMAAHLKIKGRTQKMHRAFVDIDITAKVFHRLMKVFI